MATQLRRKSSRLSLATDYEPMKATLVDAAFDDAGWIFEAKFDGVRVQVRFDGREVSLISRNDKLQNAIYPDVVDALRKAIKRPAVLDGEVVCFDDRGRTSFRALQQRFHLIDPQEIQQRAERYPAFIFLFDVLWLEGQDVTSDPLSERKRLLHRAVKWSARVRETESHAGKGKKLFQQACRRGEEGIIAKLATSRYVGGRDPAWVKIKCIGRQEFVIGGFTDPQRSRVGLGALLVGYYDDGKLAYAGKVGTGYTTETLLALRRGLDEIEQSKCPFQKGHPPMGVGVHWVRPTLVAEIAFAEWTQNDLLRQPRFEGLRTDKKPRDCKRERPRDAGGDIAEARRSAR